MSSEPASDVPLAARLQQTFEPDDRPDDTRSLMARMGSRHYRSSSTLSDDGRRPLRSRLSCTTIPTKEIDKYLDFSMGSQVNERIGIDCMLLRFPDSSRFLPSAYFAPQRCTNCGELERQKPAFARDKHVPCLISKAFNRCLLCLLRNKSCSITSQTVPFMGSMRGEAGGRLTTASVSPSQPLRMPDRTAYIPTPRDGTMRPQLPAHSPHLRNNSIQSEAQRSEGPAQQSIFELGQPADTFESPNPKGKASAPSSIDGEASWLPKEMRCAEGESKPQRCTAGEEEESKPLTECVSQHDAGKGQPGYKEPLLSLYMEMQKLKEQVERASGHLKRGHAEIDDLERENAMLKQRVVELETVVEGARSALSLPHRAAKRP